MGYLGEDFYQRGTKMVAKALLGTFLRHESEAGVTVGRIVETEAYLFKRDPACHAHRGKTTRNQVMFGPAGHAYVYLIYGMYYCFNVVTGAEDVGEAVLVRALEPVAGLELMRERRLQHSRSGRSPLASHQICSGPGKLVIAMGLGKGHNGQSLVRGSLRIQSADSYQGYATPARRDIVTTTRVGISAGAELPLRFYLRGSKFISKA